MVDPFIIGAIVVGALSAASYYQQRKMQRQAEKQANEMASHQISGHDSNRALYTVYGRALIGTTTIYKRVSRRNIPMANANFTNFVGGGGSPSTESKTYGLNRFLYRISSLSNGPINGIENVLIDGEKYTANRFTAGHTKHFEAAVSLGPTAGNHFANLRTSYATDFSAWGADKKGQGVAYVVERFWFDKSNPAYQGEPSTQYLVKGRSLYDPRLDSTVTGGSGSHRSDTPSTWAFSDNPALALLDMLTNDEYGRGVSHADCNMATFITAANKCDTLVDIPARATNTTGATMVVYDPHTGTTHEIPDNGTISNYRIDQVTTGSNANKQKRFRLNMAVDNSKEVLDNIQQILQSFRGNLHHINGEYVVHMDDVASPVLTLTDDDIIGGLKIAQGDRKQRINRMTVKFLNANKHYKTDQVSWPPIDSNSSSQYQTYLTADSGEKLHKTVTLTGCTDYYQAEDIAEYLVRESRVTLAVSGTFGSRCFNLVPGDVIALDYDSAGYSGKYFIVDQVGVDVSSMNVKLSLREYDSSVYTWNTARGNEPVALYFDEEQQYNATPTSLTLGTVSSAVVTLADGTATVSLVIPYSGVPEEATAVEIGWAPSNTTDYTTNVMQGDETKTKFQLGIDNQNIDIRARYVVTNADGLQMPSGYATTTFTLPAVSGTRLGGMDDNATRNTGVLADRDTVDTIHIEADAVTAAKIDVTDIAAINADLGAITSGSLRSGNVTNPIPTDIFTRSSNQNIPTGTENGAFVDLDNGRFVFGDADSFISFADNSAGTARELDIKGVLAPTELDLSGVSALTVMPNTIKASGYADASIGKAALSEEAYNEIAARVGNVGGFYETASGFYLGSTKYITLSSTPTHGTQNVTVRVAISDVFTAPVPFSVNSNGVKVVAKLFYKLASDTNWNNQVQAGATQTFAASPTVLQYATRYTINASYEVTLTSGSGQTIADNTNYDFRVELTRLASPNAFQAFGSGGANDSTGTPVTLEVSEGTQVVAGSGNADTLDNLDSTQFLRSDADDTMTGDLTLVGALKMGDTRRIELGDDTDLKISHSGGGGTVENDTGHLTIKNRAVDGDIYFQSDDGTGTGTDTYFYLDGGEKKVKFNEEVVISDDLTVTGNLTITGNIDQYNVTDLDVTDKTITVNSGSTQALSDGAGLIVDRGTAADASITWDETNDEFDFTNAINTTAVGVNTTPSYTVHAKGTTLTNAIVAVESSSWATGATGEIRLGYVAAHNRSIKGHYDNGLEFYTNPSSPVLTLDANAGNATFTGTLASPTVAGDDLVLREWTGNSAYSSLAHKDQSSTEYMIISKDDHTYISATTGYDVKIRGGNNVSTYEVVVYPDQDATASGNKIWHAGDFTSTNITNWNTAYGWGDHSTQGYLTAEADTLATVTGRGATTTNAISTGAITTSATVKFSSNNHYFQAGTNSVDLKNASNVVLGGFNASGINTPYNYQIGGTTVINSGRNLVNIGSIASGNISVTSASAMPITITGTNATYTALGIKNTGTGDAGIYADASNGDFAGSDYIFMGQKNNLDLDIEVGANGGNINLKAGGHARQVIDKDGYTLFPTLDLAISNANSSHGHNTYFRGGSSHFVIGMTSGNTFYLNYGNTAGTLYVQGNVFQWNGTTILDSSRNLSNIGTLTAAGTITSNNRLTVSRSTSSTTEPTATFSSGAGGQPYAFINTHDPYHGIIMRGLPAAATTYGVNPGNQMSFVEYGGDFRFYTKTPTALTQDAQILAGVFDGDGIKVNGSSVIGSNRRLTVADGTTVKAAYGFSSDSTTGISKTASGRIAFLSSGAVKAYIQTGSSNPISPVMYVDGRTEINGVVTWTGGSSTNANTAYSWGDHSTQGYLTAEADNLATVTGRGATTTNAISTGAITSSGAIIAGDNIVIGSGGTYQAGNIYSDSNWGMIFRAKQQNPQQADFLFTDYDNTHLFRFDGSYGLRIQQGGLQIGSTTVIDFSRNLTNIGTISSDAITSTGDITTAYNKTISMSYDSAGSYHKGISGLNQSTSTARGLHLFNYDNDSNEGIKFWVGTNSSRSQALHIASNTNATFANNVTASGSFVTATSSSAQGIYAGSTQVFQGSTRNLINIGTINSGAITAVGTNIFGSTATNYDQYIRGSSNVGLRIQTNAQGTTSSDGMRIGLNGVHAFVWQFEALPLAFATSGTERLSISATGGFNFKANPLSNIGTVSSGAITSSGQLSLSGNNLAVFGPNTGWSASLAIGGNANNSTSTRASIGVTSGNLHIDAAAGSFATAINFYDGTGGVYFGNGASGSAAHFNSSGHLNLAGTGVSASGYALSVGSTGVLTTGRALHNITFVQSTGDVTVGESGGTAYGTLSAGNLFFSDDSLGDKLAYSIGLKRLDNIGGNYTKLNIDWHTGITLGAATGYGGVRFLNNSVGYYNSTTTLFSVGEGDNHTRFYYELKQGSTTVIASTRRFYASDGTSVKAAYSFDGDSGTGISHTATGRIDFLSSGAIKAYIKTGTSNPISPTMYVDGRTEINGVVTWTGGSSTNANTAYGWGDHSTAGYLQTNDNITVGTITTTGTVNIGGANLNFTSNISGDGKLYFAGHGGAANYNYFLKADNDTGRKAVMFVNGSTRSADGGGNTFTIRNDGGTLRLGGTSYTTLIEGSLLQWNGTTILNATRNVSNVTLNAENAGARFQTNGWHRSNEGQRRFYFASSSNTYFGTGNDYIYRDSSDSGIATLSAGGGLNLKSGGDTIVGATVALAVGGTTVIDASRNLTNIGTISIGSTTVINSSRNVIINQKIDNSLGNLLDHDGYNNYIKGGNGGSNTLYIEASGVYTNNSIIVGNNASKQVITRHIDGKYGNSNSYENLYLNYYAGNAVIVGRSDLNSTLQVHGPIQVGTTTVIDSSRNLTNIGTISSGGITALTANGSTTLPNVVLTVQANTTSTITTGGGTAIKFKGVSSGGNIQNYDQAMIASVGQSTNNSHGLDFYYKPNGSTALTKALSIIPDGTTVARINLISHGYMSATGLVNGASYQVGNTEIVSSQRRFYASTGTSVKAAFSFDGDSTTGMYRPAASEVAFIGGGSEKLRIKSTGELEIPNGRINVDNGGTSFDALLLGGTTQSQYTNMTLYSNSGQAQIWKSGTAYTSYGGASALNIYNSNGILAFHPQGTQNVLQIDSGGLNISGTISSGAQTLVANATIIESLRNPSLSWGEYALTRYGTEGANFRYMDFGYYRGTTEATRGLVIKSQAFSTLFTFLDSGEFQVGTTTVIDASRNGVFERLRADGGNLIMGDEAYSASTGYVGMKTSYMSGSTDYMIISGLSDGNTYVSAKNGAAVNIRGGANNSNNQLVVPDSTYISVMTSNLNCTGNVTAYYSSDESLKENIRVIENPIEKIKQIRGVYFDWTDDYIKEQSGDGKIHVRKDDVGVIAQDVQPVLDEVVTTREDGTLAVRYEKMIALCIEAIKEQQDQIDSLKDIIKEMTDGNN